MADNIPSVVAKMEDVLRMCNLPLEDENFTDTPTRWLKYIKAYTQEYDPKDDLGTTFPLAKEKTEDGYDRAMIVHTGIPYRAACAHHLLPVMGQAHVGYIPKDRVVGLSKLARLVYGLSHQLPSLQEDVCDAITDALMANLQAQGAICVVTAEHGCMGARGIEEHGVDTVTSSVKGVFIKKHEARQEFYDMIKVRSR